MNQQADTAFGLYIHIPFCARKCPYCDFNTYAGLDGYIQQTVDALCLEMKRWQADVAQRTVSTVFLGGGTPTLLSSAQLEQLFNAFHAQFHIAPEVEITCEANPGTVDRTKFETLRTLGVNRLSIGVQSFQPSELTFLGRIHTTDDVGKAFAAARDVGFANINLDFIFGLPDQSTTAWRSTIEAALALNPEHLSLYSLIVEPNTPLHHWVATGQVAGPDEDVAAEHYEIAMTMLAAAGYHHYEISNWARKTENDDAPAQPLMPTLACQHNLVYWRNQDYLGIGPGAHSHLQYYQAAGSQTERRWGNRKPVPSYSKRLQQDKAIEEFSETISPRLAMGETMMLGLRLVTEGVAFDRFYDRHGQQLTEVFADEIEQLQAWGLLSVEADRVRLTERGVLMGNRVAAHFLPENSV